MGKERYIYKPDKFFDEDFKEKVAKALKAESEPRMRFAPTHPIVHLYRSEKWNQEFWEDCGANFPHIYDKRRIECVEQKLIELFGSVEAALEKEKNDEKAKFKRNFPNGLIGALTPVNETEEEEKYGGMFNE